MRKESKSSAVFIFVGLLLIVIFAVGAMLSRDPGLFRDRYHYDYALESFLRFCGNVWLPAGVIGIPMFLISMILSLRNERKRDRD